MKFIPLFLSAVFLLLTLPGYSAEYDIEGVLDKLDDAVANSDFYYRRRAYCIDSIKKSMPDSTVSLRIARYERIGDEFSLFDNDSVLIYYSRGLNAAIECGCDSLIDVFRLKLSSHMPIAGFVTLATTYYESVDTAGMSDDMKYLYFRSGRDMNYFIGILYRSFSSDPDIWTRHILECQRNMIEFQDKTTDRYSMDMCDYYFLTNRSSQAWETLIMLLDRASPDTYIYASVARSLARIAGQRGDTDALKYYLAVAARVDITSGTREVSSLQQLAALLFKENDVYRAYGYMTASLNNAAECNAVARIREISPQLPLISRSHEKLMDWWTVAYAVIISVLATCIIVIIVIAYSLVRHLRRMKAMQSRLVDANRAKEVYISQFMVLCSVYMEKLNQFNSLVNRKIGSGQTDELYRLTRTGKLVEEQTRDFYPVFDDAFLHIYPTFVDEVNSLLLPSGKIVLKDGERLNTDLRILACIRLGLVDANRISQILNYSVNTIYSYRNRLRNRAINRDTFESDLMRLGLK